MNHVTQEGASEVRGDAVRVLAADELAEVGGGYPCSYLGVEDWSLMMSYSSRNYSC